KNFAVRSRVKNVVTCAGEKWDVGTNGRGIQARHIAQGSERLFRETCPRAETRITRLRQRQESEPNMIGVIADVLLAQAHETRDEQRCAREQGDGKGDLRADKDFSKPQLLRARTRTARAFFQSFDQLRLR